ncbi:MAG TPA: galactokinase [Blastocatellia bacterium]|nr:galactokinase [Blastocatellia bacterium]
MSVRRVFSAPGRVNLIGEHTDYNAGFVLPAAINRRTTVVAKPRSDGIITAASDRFETTYEIDLNKNAARPTGDWADHVLGMVEQLRLAGHTLVGADLAISSDVPAGAGLASSAAITVVCGYALLRVAGSEPDRLEIALAAQLAENEFVGTRCGVMDQLASCFGVRGSALLIDCMSLERRPVNLPRELKIVVADSTVRHKLASSQYNERRAECEEAVRLLNEAGLSITFLRDIESVDQLLEYRSVLPDNLLKRARHVVSENKRVLEAATALESRDFDKLGELMLDSHNSLRDDYGVSSELLDGLVEAAGGAPGLVGARMTGGGFGGCTVNLVRDSFTGDFQTHLRESFKNKTGISPEVTIFDTDSGVTEEPT